MSGSTCLRLLDRKTNVWFCSQKLSAFSPVFFVNNQNMPYRRTFHTHCISNLKGSFLTPGGKLANPVNFKDIGIVCKMSSKGEPPDITNRNPLPDANRENKQANELLNTSSFGNMLRIVKEKSSGFSTITSKLPEGASTLVTNVIPQSEAVSKNPKKPEDWNDILNRWYVKYQDFIGITDLKNAQDKVTELSEGLLSTQSRRRNLQAELEELQEKLTLNHQRITKAELYSEEHYQLFDQARDMNARLKEVRTEFESCERLERDTFTQLSAAIRDCHERERTQAEQSKYWSIIASIVSAALASVITSVNNWVRIREIKDHVSANNKSLIEGYEKMHEDIVGAVNAAIPSIPSLVTEKKETSEATETLETTPVVISDNKTTLRLTEEDVKLLSDTLLETVKEQTSVAVVNESKLTQEALKPHLDAIFTNLGLILEGNKMLADMVTSGKDSYENKLAVEEVNKLSVVSPTVEDMTEKEASKSVVFDYGYRHIASAMAVGAGIGTLATAFFLGSFSGATGD